MEIEMKDLAKNKTLKDILKESYIDSPETQRILKIYLEGHRNKSCPPSLFYIILTFIILIILILISDV